MLSRDGNSRPVRRLDGIVVGQPRVVKRTSSPAEEPSPAPTPLPEPALSLPEPKLAGTPRRTFRRRRRALKYGLVGAAVVAVLPIIILAALTPAHVPSKFAPLSLAASAVKAAVEQPATLKGESSGRTNVLVYGMTKDGLRTDSIMLASYYYGQKKLVTLNIPRDLYVYDGYENCKMGEIYAYAKGREPKNPEYPADYVASVISKEYGINIDYWVKFNMQGEVQLVDTLGGIDINVPDSFTDYEYPTWNYTGYIRPAPHFNAGLQHMNGSTALIYSRSRHSLDNGEGSDFARSKRQALVLAAVMTKVKSLGIVGNLGDIQKYLTILGQNVDTDMSSDEMVAMAKLFKGVDPTTDYLKGNWATGNGFLCNSTSSVGAYITMYGVPGDCTGEAGITTGNIYRTKAISYVQNLLVSVTPPQPSPSIQPQELGASTGPSK
jgi:polyisoprenyl-teichoic acid--peptidoglycan teichoic acid transferase